jgi:hypothetical protein
MELRQVNLKGYEQYQVTDDGKVFNTKTNRWIKPYICKIGYVKYNLSNTLTNKRTHILAHRFVAYTYLPLPENINSYEVDHIDEVKTNNHYTNLQWITHSENISKSFALGKRISTWKGKKRGELKESTKRKMSLRKLEPINIYRRGTDQLLYTSKSVQDAADYLGISRTYIWMCLNVRNGFYRFYRLQKV